jgi:hypothetical protein
MHALRSVAELVTAYAISPVEIERDRETHAGLKGFTRQPIAEASQAPVDIAETGAPPEAS